MGTATAMSARSLQYYVIARRWASDLEFFKIETSFLYRLAEDHFTHLSGDRYYEPLKQISKMLLKLEQDQNDTSKLVNDQLIHVELMAEDFITENAEVLAVNQVQLEYMVTNLIADYRVLKRELFSLVEHIMRENKQTTNIKPL